MTMPLFAYIEVALLKLHVVNEEAENEICHPWNPAAGGNRIQRIDYAGRRHREVTAAQNVATTTSSNYMYMYLTTLRYIHPFIHSDHFYSDSSSPLLFSGATDTARMLYRSFTSKRHRQLRVKDLPKVPTWRLERNSNPRPFGRKATNLPMSHHAPCIYMIICT